MSMQLYASYSMRSQLNSKQDDQKGYKYKLRKMLIKKALSSTT